MSRTTRQTDTDGLAAFLAIGLRMRAEQEVYAKEVAREVEAMKANIARYMDRLEASQKESKEHEEQKT